MALLTLSGLVSGVFMAAEGAGHAAPAGAEHKAGLPQLAVETFGGQLFWLAVTFIALFVILSFFVLPRIRGVLERRQAAIGGDLAAAAAAKGKADDALKAYETALADARNRARTMADETRNAMRAESDQRRAAAEAKLNADLDQATAQIASTKSAALANVRGVASDTAAAIVERLTGETVSASEAQGAVDAALAR